MFTVRYNKKIALDRLGRRTSTTICNERWYRTEDRAIRRKEFLEKFGVNLIGDIMIMDMRTDYYRSGPNIKSLHLED